MSNRFEVAAYELEAYERDGVVCLRNMVPPERCRQMPSAVHTYLETRPGANPTSQSNGGWASLNRRGLHECA
jgi:hypothetical protein